MTQEEKAKAYDEAKLRMSAAYNSNRCTIGFMNEIFPELKESEDERIRKALMQNLKERFGTKGNMGEGLDMPDVLAWFEKQAEWKPIKEHNACDFCDEKHGCVNPCPTKLIEEQKSADKVDKHSLPVSDNSSLPTFDESIYHPCSEEVCEQKSVESRQETKPNGGIVCEDFNEGDGYYKVNLAYLSKSQVEFIENLVASWQNSTNNTAEWSEEDNAMLISIENILIGRGHSFHDKEINWIKSLRHRKLCSYNPYKAVVESIAEMCKHYDKATDLQDFYDNVKVKCKDAKEYDSLFPSQWKPSDEQMKALEIAIRSGIQLGTWEEDALKSLAEQLKNLRKE